MSGYRSIVDAGGDTICPVRDENGQMKPYTDWEYKGYLFYQLAIDDSFRFFMKPASEFEVDCICQVTVKDVNGNLHGTNYVELDLEGERETAEIGTEKGTLYFDLKEDGAQLTKYTGQDTSLAVPDRVLGKPVTAIGQSAFSGIGTLESVTLPDSVTQIGKSAFYGTEGLRQIRLPARLETIGVSAIFAEITVSGNPHYRSVDGVLYSADGKALVQYPAGRAGGEYTVEEGTEEIGYGAFAQAGLEKVEFPQTLRTIDNDAFRVRKHCQVPDSLQRIGSMAFGRDRAAEEVPEGQMPLDSVRIGPAVTSIGTDAFTALQIAAFEVDGANPVYASSGGFITNKAGDMIQTVPMMRGSSLVIPEGITTLQSGLFTAMDETMGFYVPDSVFRFSENVFPRGKETSRETGKLEEIYRCTLHCSKDSAARQ